ncbi:MAG: hypothetical protein H7Y33_15940 [Cytophagales bacterium]|nr:hypothetical protein [Rhizobacter sp.]
MNLPWIGLQAVWAHFAWGVVLAACGVGVLARKKPLSPGATRLAVAWVVLAFVACALPGAASPAYWLGLAFHFPSGLLVVCCAITVWNAQGVDVYRVMPAGLAALLVAAGLVLYLDSAGWFSLGLYARGFGHEAALVGLLAGLLAVLAVVFGARPGAAFALLLSLMLFAVLRLPSGNVWDAVLDPLLWLWALFSLLARWRAGRSRQPA